MTLTGEESWVGRYLIERVNVYREREGKPLLCPNCGKQVDREGFCVCGQIVEAK